jgi:solute carrier family 25 thiamine pyrophosphate transporter 19
MNEVLTKQMFEYFPSLRKSDSNTKTLALVRSACGAPAAVLATFASYPFDVLRTRKIAQLTLLEVRNSSMYYSTTLGSAKLIWRLEGAKGFYKGMTPQLVSMVPYSSLAFGFYEFFTQTCYRSNFNTYTNSEDGRKYLGIYGKCLSSALSGVLAKSLTYPLDTVRKRLQIQGFELGRMGMGETHKYSGMRDCFTKIIQNEGYKGFFKGLVPGNLKAALSTVLYFQFYEVFKQKISQYRQNKQ